MQKYICKCGRTFEKSTNAATTGYIINDYTPEHECYGCPYIVTESDWTTKEIVKRECRATPKITYLTRCCIGTEKGDFSSCKLFSLDLVFVKRVLNYINSLDGAEAPTEFTNCIPDTWRASDFGQCYSFSDCCFGLAIFELSFKKNKKGTEARRLVKERFFYDNGIRRDVTEESERETVLMRIQIAKENAGNKTVINENKKTEENNNMGKFNINTLISQDEQLKQIALDLLIPYHNHKFKLYDGERFEDMVNSIKANGVLTPIIVRPAPNVVGKYEILAGHNRCNAARQAGLNTVPGIVKERLSDEEAEMYVIETNAIQRGFNDLSLSERAAVVAMRHSQMFDPQKCREIQQELNAIERMEESEKKSKLALTGEEYSLSKNSVARLIRINKLIEGCDKYRLSVDSGSLSVRAAVELSYITSKEALNVIFDKYSTGVLVNNIWEDVAKINSDKALWLREIFEGFDGNREQAERLFNERHRAMTNEDIEKVAAKPIKISIPPDTFLKYFTEKTKPDEAADIIDKALEMYFKAEKEENAAE